MGRGLSLVKSVVRGPTIIGEECKIDPGAYVGRYVAIGDRCEIILAEVENSIVMEDAITDFERKLAWSVIGKSYRQGSDR